MARAKKTTTKKPAAKTKAKPATKTKKPARKAAAKKKPAAKSKATKPAVTAASRSSKAAVLELFRDFYSAADWDEAKILDTDPNGFDLDPGPFYEQLGQIFGVVDHPNSSYFGGFGGKVSQTIAFIDKTWDGKLREPDEESMMMD